MKRMLLLNDLLSIKENSSCRNYLSKIEDGFKYVEFREKTQFSEDNTRKNYLFFFLEGSFTLNYNNFSNKIFQKGEMILLPKASCVKGWGEKSSKLLVFLFDVPRMSWDKLALQSLTAACRNLNYKFTPVFIRYPLISYLEILAHCLKKRINYPHLHETKERELFLLLRGFYSKEELAKLFYPIVGKELDFRNFILQNYRKVESVKELISLSNMGRTCFFSKFKKEFGAPVKQWMLKQNNERLLEKASEPGITIKKLMDDCGFESPSYFNHYCRKQFGCTPQKIIERCQTDYQ